MQKSALNDIKEANDFDVVRHNTHKWDHATPRIYKKSTDVDTVAQGTHPCGALYMVENVVSAGSKTI